MKSTRLILRNLVLVVIIVLFSACDLLFDVRQDPSDGLSTGALFSELSGDQLYRFGGVAGEANSVSIPASFMIRDSYPYFGPIKNQGNQNSCVGQALAYFMTYSENRLLNNKNPADKSEDYSGNFIYNQLCGGADEGIRVVDGLNFLAQKGDCTLSLMDDSKCGYTTQPSDAAKAEAAQHKAESWYPLSSQEDIKAAVSGGVPVVINVAATSALLKLTANRDTYDDVSAFDAAWHPLYGGHALVVVGYDPSYFHVVSSWGSSWGKNGVGRIGKKAMSWILREAYYLDDSVLNLSASATEWKESFDESSERGKWLVGTNHTPYATLDNWKIEAGAMRQTMTQTAAYDQATGRWSDGYSSVVKDAPRPTRKLSANSLVTVRSTVRIGERNEWFPRVGPISFGFNFSSIGQGGAGHYGTVWLQNAFGSRQDQNDASKVMGFAIDGRDVSTWEGNTPFAGYRSLLSVQEVAKLQKGGEIEFKFVMDLARRMVKGYIRFAGDAQFTEVATYVGQEIGDFAGGPLMLQPILGCVGTVCDFEEVVVESGAGS